MLEQVRNEAKAAALEICQVAKLRKGQILVVGCSTSEVTGHKVGSYSSPELGQAIYEGIQEALQPQGIYLAAQCCEHLNRAIIVEAEAVPGADICNVVPQPKAGGSFATAAYHGFQHPVALEEIRAAGVAAAKAHGKPAVQAILKDLGAPGMTALDPGQYREFMRKLGELNAE